LIILNQERIVIQLSANHCDAMVELIHSGEAPVDMLEIGPWLSLNQVQVTLQQLPGWKFQFHPGSLITGVGLLPGAVRKIKAYMDATQSLWASFHATLLPPGYEWLAQKKGWYLPFPNPKRAAQHLAWQVEQVKKALSLPVILENMSSLPGPHGRYVPEADPRMLSEVIEATGSGLLLDLAHARIGAQAMKMEVHELIKLLPLERLQQIHVSGPRWRDGVLFDAHQSLQEEDYALLEWVLERAQPRVVTLEYIRERDILRQMLYRLYKVLK
jgi:uncharacterized protein (UPF0276 family)